MYIVYRPFIGKWSCVLGSGMRVSASFQVIPRRVGRLGLGLRSGPQFLYG